MLRPLNGVPRPQAKYLKKKKQKYMMRVVVRRPTARVICESAFQQDPRRICNIRIEALTLGLSQAGVAANARVLVVGETGDTAPTLKSSW